jgi:glycopeptide antibiotics resistance protein
MQKSLFEFLLTTVGCLIFLFSLSFDRLYQGSPGIGFDQLVGMTIGLLIILIGIRYKLLPAQLKWDWFLFVVYLSGILFVGLWPSGSSTIYQNSLLGMNIFSTRDFALNVVGFIPLGFLILPLVGYTMSSNKIIRLVAIAAAMGFSVSLVIEILQYFWIPGRYSSAYDLVTNTFGTIIGALCWLSIGGHRLISLKI